MIQRFTNYSSDNSKTTFVLFAEGNILEQLASEAQPNPNPTTLRSIDEPVKVKVEGANVVLFRSRPESSHADQVSHQLTKILSRENPNQKIVTLIPNETPPETTFPVFEALRSAAQPVEVISYPQGSVPFELISSASGGGTRSRRSVAA